MQFFSNDLGVDLGTANVLIYADGKGIVVREPSVVAVDKNTGRILQVGSAARNMLGRTPGNVVAMRPLQGGVISDHEMTVRLLQTLFRKATKTGLFTPKPRVVICVPSGVTEVEERTVINAAIEAGARRVYLIEEPLAAALGAGLDIQGPNGHMVVDVGAGTTDIAVLSLNGVAASSSLTIAGDVFDETIARYVRRRHGVIIGQTTAEDVKIQIGSVYPRPEDISMNVKGRDAKNGVPRELTLLSSEVYEVLAPSCPADRRRGAVRAGGDFPGIGQRHFGERHHPHRRRKPDLGYGNAYFRADRHRLHHGRRPGILCGLRLWQEP